VIFGATLRRLQQNEQLSLLAKSDHSCLNGCDPSYLSSDMHECVVRPSGGGLRKQWGAMTSTVKSSASDPPVKRLTRQFDLL
jgi:hypothetical protein